MRTNRDAIERLKCHIKLVMHNTDMAFEEKINNLIGVRSAIACVFSDNEGLYEYTDSLVRFMIKEHRKRGDTHGRRGKGNNM